MLNALIVAQSTSSDMAPPVEDNKGISAKLAAYANFIKGKERAGIERAVLANFDRKPFTCCALPLGLKGSKTALKPSDVINPMNLSTTLAS